MLNLFQPLSGVAFSAERYRSGLGDRIVDRDTARELGRYSMLVSESWRRNDRAVLALTLYD